MCYFIHPALLFSMYEKKKNLSSILLNHAVYTLFVPLLIQQIFLGGVNDVPNPGDLIVHETATLISWCKVWKINQEGKKLFQTSIKKHTHTHTKETHKEKKTYKELQQRTKKGHECFPYVGWFGSPLRKDYM